MERERERRQWEDQEWREYDEQRAAEARRDEKIEVCPGPCTDLLRVVSWQQ